MAERSIRRARTGWSQVRVGVLLIIALLVVAYGVYRIGDLFNVFAARYQLVTLVTNAAGLTEGALVTLAGRRVGQVESIEFVPVGEARPYHVSLWLAIDEEVNEQIRSDSRARIRTQGLLGDKYVDIAPGSAAARVLEPGDTIPSIEAIEFEDLLATASTTLGEMQSLVLDLRRITGSLIHGEGTLGRLLTDDRLYQRAVGATTQLQVLLDEVQRSDGTLGRLIRDPTLYQEIRGAISRVDSLGAQILHGEGTLSLLLRDDELYLGLLGVVGRADSTIATLNGTIGALTDGEGTIQRLLRDPTLYDQFLKAVVDLQALINDIRAHPRRYRPEVNIDIF